MAGVTHFLIVAVEYYHSPSITRVTFAEEDAQGLVKAWQDLGYDKADFTVLINNAATKTAIETNLKRISLKAGKDDRIVVFFAGHGCSLAGENMIVPVDAQYGGMLKDTCLSINRMLGLLKKAESERNLLFLDCCHSGFEPGEDVRRVAAGFSTEALAERLKDEVYCVGFASCKSNQESISSGVIRHGVWTHFLIDALSGNAEEDIYEDNCLTSENLQSWLRRETPAFIKKNKMGHHEQTPMAFGSWSDRFVIEDLTPVFEAREAARRAAAFNMTSIEIFDTDEDDIKDLPGYQKGWHRVPDKVGRAENDFVQKKVGNLVSNEINKMSEKIKNAMGYTRKEIKVTGDEGVYEGAIETPDFSYMVEISQSQEYYWKYSIKRSLVDVTNPDIINDANFNGLFDKHFRQLSFLFDKPIDTDKLIDRIEAKGKAAGVKLEYKPADTSRVTVIFPGLSSEIVIEPYSINITVPIAASPAALVEVYKETNRLLEGAKIKLIETSK